jgi:hypothetical protein
MGSGLPAATLGRCITYQVGAQQSGEVIKPEHQSFWSFQPITGPQVPEVKGDDQGPIDAFLLAGLERVGLTFQPEADRRTLLSRATYDLTGLPPSRPRRQTFSVIAAREPLSGWLTGCWRALHYGERWARHWLDLARYSGYVGMVDAVAIYRVGFPTVTHIVTGSSRH